MCIKTRFYFLLILGLAGLTQVSAQVKSVLWIGNSYTATNNLPNLVYQLALSGGDTITYDSNTPGGYTFMDHWSSLTTQLKITQQPWDYVVLQAQSQEPSWDSSYVTNWLYPYGEAFDSVIHLNDSCTQMMFYMTWGRKNGDAQFCAQYPAVCTYQGMQDQLTHRYLHLAHTNNAIVAPCGEAWRDVIATTPTFDLYSPDESHPSLHGSYLNACVFYASIYRRSPVGLTYYAGLPIADAQFLQQVAASCVLDSMSLWNTEVYYDDASFTVGVSGSTYFFLSTEPNTAHQWNFGEGFVPGVANEQHTFTSTGMQLVTHVTDNGCRTDTSSQWVNVTAVGIPGVWNCIPEPRIKAYPVPADESFTVQNPFAPADPGMLELIDFDGRVVLSSPCSGETFCISTAHLAEGFYTLRITQGAQQVSRKVTVIHKQ